MPLFWSAHTFVKMLMQVPFPLCSKMDIRGSLLESGNLTILNRQHTLNNFRDRNVGRLGSFTVPFRAVDEIPRWVPLWFPSGGKSHAYNLLGGKRVNFL